MGYFHIFKGLILTKVFLLIGFLETSWQIWVNFPDSDLKSSITSKFGNFLDSLTLNFNLVSELQTYVFKFCYDAEREEVEGF